MIIRDLLEKHEGFRKFPYKDTVGKLTIGIGRNLDDRGLTRMEALYLLDNDIADFTLQLQERFFWFDSIDPIAEIVLIDMAFNMGIGGLSTFNKTLEHLKNHNYKMAALEMLKSKWAFQVGSRANDLSNLLINI